MKQPAILSALALIACLGVVPAGAHDGARYVTGPADAYVYSLAEPGTYALPRIRKAGDAELLDETGTALRLSSLFSGRITLMAFMYTRCGDVCPVAAMSMADLQMLAGDHPQAAADLQLVSVSFDPAHDTPARLSEYAMNMRPHDIDEPRWLFLTAESEEAMATVLEAYDQPVIRKSDPDDLAGPFSDLLSVVLVDGDGMVRNIYSADFLDLRLVLNDVLTLQAGQHRTAHH